MVDRFFQTNHPIEDKDNHALTENCLRDVIAVSSIVGLGFRLRDEAIANLAGSAASAFIHESE